MTINILPETFQPGTATVEQSSEHFAKQINGTVSVEYGRETITVYASRNDGGDIYAFGFVGRYRTGGKDWIAVVRRAAGNDYTSARFGRDDRSGQFHKQQGVRFAPEAFFKI